METRGEEKTMAEGKEVTMGWKITSRLSVALALFLAMAGSAWSVNVEELRQRAEQGDVKAQLNLGTMYGNGQGVPKDHAEAAKWYRKAAEQ
jgi:TPR repeat protein